MADTDLPKEDDVLRRMLNTPPTEHKTLSPHKKAVNPGKPGDPAGPGRHWGTAKASGLDE